MLFGIGVFFVVLLIALVFSAQGDQNNKSTEASMVLKLIYTFLIGIFLAVFVGVGIAAFYPGPKYPEQPMILKYCPQDLSKSTEQSAEVKSQLEIFDKEEKDYLTKSQIYNRNVSTISLVASIFIVIASLTLFKTILLIADGLLLGGVLTLIYSVMRGFGSEDNMFRFIVVSVGLFISLFLGYVKFIKPPQKTSK